jgi:hypothetical protein
MRFFKSQLRQFGQLLLLPQKGNQFLGRNWLPQKLSNAEAASKPDVYINSDSSSCNARGLCERSSIQYLLLLKEALEVLDLKNTREEEDTDL